MTLSYPVSFLQNCFILYLSIVNCIKNNSCMYLALNAFTLKYVYFHSLPYFIQTRGIEIAFEYSVLSLKPCVLLKYLNFISLPRRHIQMLIKLTAF